MNVTVLLFRYKLYYFRKLLHYLSVYRSLMTSNLNVCSNYGLKFKVSRKLQLRLFSKYLDDSHDLNLIITKLTYLHCF